MRLLKVLDRPELQSRPALVRFWTKTLPEEMRTLPEGIQTLPEGVQWQVLTSPEGKRVTTEVLVERCSDGCGLTFPVPVLGYGRIHYVLRMSRSTSLTCRSSPRAFG